ncbi:MAG: DUF1559 domain-containing protein [Pirellulales bacterium]
MSRFVSRPLFDPRTPRRRRRGSRMRRGFTLVELLVVIAIIGILVALILPAIQAARESARRSQCENNLKQQGLAVQLHLEARKFFPHSWPNGEPNTIWGRSLLPYLEESTLDKAFDPKIGIADGANAALAATPLAVYKCPTSLSPATYEYTYAGGPKTYGTSDYKGVEGVNANDPLFAAWGRVNWLPGVIGRVPVRLRQVIDGTSKTVTVCESPGGFDLYGPNFQKSTFVASIWYHTDGSWVGRALCGLNPTAAGPPNGVALCTINCTSIYDGPPYSFHPGGAQVMVADGSVHFLPEETDATILGALFSYNDGQAIQPW